VHPFGDGGAATVANVRVHCRSHNQHEARRFFGPWNADSTPDPRVGSGTARTNGNSASLPRTASG
jgi:hypothetical protein